MRAVVLGLVLVACGSDKSPSGTTDTTVAPNDVVGDVAGQSVCEPAGPITLACVEEARLRTTLDAIAGPRAPGDAKHTAAAALCKSTFTELGFTVSETPATAGTNVIGVRTGTSKPNELVVVGAHYDGVPGCDAADDNGSGVAGLLEAARVLRARDHARTLVVACWDTEEDGLVGSESHAQALADADADVAMAYVFEMIGYQSDVPNSQRFPGGFDLLFPEAGAALAAREKRGDFIAVIIGDDAAGPNAAMAAAATAIGLPAIPVVLSADFRTSPALGDLRRSDHASFWKRGYPAVMITDTANFRNPNYHCYDGTADTVATLDFTFMRRVTAMTAMAAEVTLDASDRGTTRRPSDP